MKTIAVPIMAGTFSSHFGGADSFALYRVDESTGEVRERQMMAPPEHGRGIFPMWLRSLGADVVLAGGMGPRASGILAQHGIEVVLGVQGDDPDTVVRQFLSGTLVATGEACHEHGFHDCRHHEHQGGGGGCRSHHENQ